MFRSLGIDNTLAPDISDAYAPIPNAAEVACIHTSLYIRTHEIVNWSLAGNQAQYVDTRKPEIDSISERVILFH